jgi:hypothetical protein
VSKKSAIFLPHEEITMNVFIRKHVGACAILLGILTATTGAAMAKVTIACMQHLQVSGGSWPSEAQAKAAAQKNWSIAALNKYGHAWANLANAKNKHFSCSESKGGNWACSLSAQACAPVKPPSASAHLQKIQPLQWRLPQQKTSRERHHFAPPTRMPLLPPQLRSTGAGSSSGLR